MTRYIDAEKFKQQLEIAMKKMHLIGGVKGVDVGAVIKAIDMQPTADVVPVVRCKDCEHYDKGGCNHFGYHTYTPDVDEDDFCSNGERKGGTE